MCWFVHDALCSESNIFIDRNINSLLRICRGFFECVVESYRYLHLYDEHHSTREREGEGDEKRKEEREGESGCVSRVSPLVCCSLNLYLHRGVN